MNNLKGEIVKNFRDNIINVNGKEYVSLDVFQTAVSEVAVLESLLGAIALKLKKDIFISENEAIEYMTTQHTNVNISYDEGIYVIKTR